MRRFRLHLWDEGKRRRKVLIWPAQDEATARAEIANWLVKRHWWALVKVEET